jgi:hypothetical protein
MLFRKVPGNYRPDTYGAQQEQADSHGQFYDLQRSLHETVRWSSELRISVFW